ncbi:HNH endonuclease [bacterium]|nr:HNH endonuclease [bacterium]
MKKKPTSKSLWYEQGAMALKRLGLNLPYDCYICPICLRGFKRQEITALTKEHVPPEGVGGQRLVLTCYDCNSTAGGAGIDSHACERERELDFFLGTMREARFVRLSMEGYSGNVRVQNVGGGMLITGVPKNNPPGSEERMIETMNGHVEAGTTPSFKLSFFGKGYSRRKQAVSWFRAAYLAMFARWGYRYILRSVLDPVRGQIQNPDREVITAIHYLSPKTDLGVRAIMVVNEPEWVKGFCIWMGRHMVIMPFDDNDTDFFNRLHQNYGERCNASGKKILEWPKKPEFGLDLCSPQEFVETIRAIKLEFRLYK